MATSDLSGLFGTLVLALLYTCQTTAAAGTLLRSIDLGSCMPCDYIAQDVYAPTACNGVPGLCSVPLSLVTFPATHNSAAIKTELSAGGISGLGSLGGVVSTYWDNQDITLATQLESGIRGFDMDVAFKRVSDSEAAALGSALGLSTNEVRNHYTSQTLHVPCTPFTQGRRRPWRACF